jgi:hypothetical protein
MPWKTGEKKVSYQGTHSCVPYDLDNDPTAAAKRRKNSAHGANRRTPQGFRVVGRFDFALKGRD